MRRFLLALLTTATAAILIAACTADLNEGCLAGGCPSVDVTASTSSGAGGSTCGAVPATGDFPCAVFTVIHDKCNPCHQDPTKVGAPFPLLSFEDTQQIFDSHGKLRYQRMHEVIQSDGSPHMPLKSKTVMVDPLTDDEFATLDAWLACPTVLDQGTGCECPGMGCD